MPMVRKTFRLTPDQQAKLERLVQHTGRSESEIIRGALVAISEDTNPVILALKAQGMILPKDTRVTREEAKRTYEAYLKQIGKRHIGLTQAVLEDRATQQE
jgi:predicted DNA-binding protein